MKELVIKDLSVSANGVPILNNLNLTIRKGECIALLGPNGHGKSTFLNVLMGSPQYEITNGTIALDGEDLLSLSVDERARKGLFMAFQSPPEVPGVIASEFYRAGVNARRGSPVGAYAFRKELNEACEKTGLNPDLLSRNLNAGFSGGERKRNEVLQMLILNPEMAFLDEIDSGLDVDALSLVAESVKSLREKGTTFIVISHYDRLYKLIRPEKTVVIVNGTVAVEGDGELAERISSKGYGFLEKEYGISLKKITRVPDMPGCSTGAMNVEIRGA
ncbi:MAG: Fe-S cluster assembly ATPase SufC [archaeon]|nr:Fe-S cluster assembly ATPase SufC [archaeon]